MPSPDLDIARLYGRHGDALLMFLIRRTADPDLALDLWSETFAQRGRDAAALGFDAVYRRMWSFHLAALETGLRSGWVESVQLLATAGEAVRRRADGRTT